MATGFGGIGVRIKNWAKFQHYKGKAVRNAPWIKLYTKLLNDRQWHALSGNASKLLAMLWLIANEHDSEGGTLPSIADIAFRTRLLEKEVAELLFELDHWVELDASTMLADCQQVAPEKERRGEGEEIERESENGAKAPPPPRLKSHPLPQDWTPTESHFLQGEKLGYSAPEVHGMADDMRYWAWGKGECRKSWDMTFSGWIRREHKRAPPKAQTRTAAAIINLRERAKHGNSRPGICNGGGELPSVEFSAAGPGSGSLRESVDSPLRGPAEISLATNGKSDGGSCG